MDDQIPNNIPNQSEQPVVPPVIAAPEVVQNRSIATPVVLTLLLSALIFGVGGFFIGKQKSTLPTPLESLSPIPSAEQVLEKSPTPQNTSTNNLYTNQFFTFNYPTSWKTENTMVFEQRSNCDPETSRCSVQKNVVDIRSNRTQIYQGYTNGAWFNKISGLTSPWNSDGEVFTKLAVGSTSEGKSYVIFKQSPAADFEGEAFMFLIGYVLDGKNLYELRLSDFESDSVGLVLMKSLIESVKIK